MPGFWSQKPFCQSQVERSARAPLCKSLHSRKSGHASSLSRATGPVWRPSWTPPVSVDRDTFSCTTTRSKQALLSVICAHKKKNQVHVTNLHKISDRLTYYMSRSVLSPLRRCVTKLTDSPTRLVRNRVTRTG